MNVIPLNKQPKNTFKITVDFQGDKKEYFHKNEEDMFMYKTIYQKYMEKLKENWNEYCNVESYMIEDVIEELFSDDEKDFEKYSDIVDYWEYNTDYPNFLAIPTNLEFSYYDEDGIEYRLNDLNQPKSGYQSIF